MIIIDENSSETLNKIKKSIKNGINFTEKCAITPWNIIGDSVESSQIELEGLLKNEFGINTKHWYFSRENVALIEKIIILINLTTTEVKHLSSYKSLKYLICYTILQKINRTHNSDIIFRNKSLKLENLLGKFFFKFSFNFSSLILVHYLTIYFLLDEEEKKIEEKCEEELDPFYLDELEKIQTECARVCIFAHACYGDLMNYVYSGKETKNCLKIFLNLTNSFLGKNILKVVRTGNYDTEFVNHTKIKKSDLLYSSWESTPCLPAYCICIDHSRKEILLCLRGSLNWADFVTDLVFTYLSFSVLELENKEKYIRINYNLHVNSAINYILIKYHFKGR